MNKQLSCKCGSKEFITQLNGYSVYQVIDDKLQFMSQELTDDELLYCRDCGEQKQK